MKHLKILFYPVLLLSFYLRESDQLCVAKEEALQIFERVDTLLDGSLEDHNSAFQLLATYENEVYKTFIVISYN